jgi:hypothetical protein
MMAHDPRVLPAGWAKVTYPGGYGWKSPAGLMVISSAATEDDGKEWLHLSVSRQDRLPSWDDLVEVKEVFGGTATSAIQVIPPRAEYVNCHPNVLHLWVCLDESPLPDFRRHGCI